MMEAIGVAASLIGITATAITWLSQLIERLDNFKTRKEKLQELIEDLASLRTLVTRVQTLMGYWESRGPKLPYGLGRDTLDGVGIAVLACHEDIEEMLKDLQ